MTLLKGVYWDLDGTIANTELEAHLPAFNESFKDLGINWYWDPITYIKLLKVNGGKKRISYFSKTTNSNISNDLVIRIHERKQFHYLESIKRNNLKLKEGVGRLIKELYEQKVRQFIVTSSSKKQVNALINSLFGDFKPFEFIISSDDVELHKPNPLPYLKAIQQSGIRINQSIVFEDSNPGINSSLAAKLPTIFVHSNIPTKIDSYLKLNCVIDSLGNDNRVSNVIKGPKLDRNYIDYSYLNKFLISSGYAKN